MLNLIKLENRIVLDGAAVGDAVEHAFAAHEAVIAGKESSFVPEHTGDTDHIADVAALLTDDAAAEPETESIEIVLIADNLPDHQALTDAATPDAHVIVYDAENDSAENVMERVKAISEELGRPVESLSILSHGGEGIFRLGNDVITQENLDETAEAWEALDAVLSDQGRIYLFGCNVANDAGQELLNRLADITGADVFGSDDATGAGGDWDLEAASENADKTLSPPLDAEALASYSDSLDSAPTISGQPSGETIQGTFYSFKPTASDPDGDSFDFSISNQPSWTEFDPATGELTGTPDNENVGIYRNIKIMVTDSTGLSTSLDPFDLVVDNLNDPPTISGRPTETVQEGKSYTFTPILDDPDLLHTGADTHTYSIANKPDWANFDPETGTLSGTPGREDVGTTTGIVITVTDKAGLNASLPAFNITVEKLNREPVISGTPDTSVNQNGFYDFKPTASDPDGDTLTYSISYQPPWADFDPQTGRLSGTPENDDVGVNEGIVITVTDNNGLSDSLDPFNLTVVNVNDAPTIGGTPSDSVQQGKPYSFTPNTDDPDLIHGDAPPTFSIENKPEWANFNAQTGELYGTPVRDDIGTTTEITITATDSKGLSASLDPFDITVERLNLEPTIVGNPLTSVNQDGDYSFTPIASDPDDDPLTFSISNQPTWTTFNPETGELKGTPGNDDVGITTDIVITVTDSEGFSDSLDPFNLTVVNVNDPPTISGLSSGKVLADKLYSFRPTSSDPDLPYGDTVSFSITNKPAWATFDPATGKLSGTPGKDDVGDYSDIVITVTDSSGEKSDLDPFTLTVVKESEAPVIMGTPDLSVDQGEFYTFTPTATDPDGDTDLTFSISSQPPWMTFEKDGTLSGTPTNEDVGFYNNITIAVTDSDGLSDALTFNLVVDNVNDPPTISGTSAQSVQEGKSYTFTPTSDDPDLLWDDDELIYSIENKPPWTTFDETTGTLSGVPSREALDQEGIDVKDLPYTYEDIVITVRDSSWEEKSLTFDLTVEPLNNAPVIEGDPPTVVKQGGDYVFQPTAYDPDGDELVFSISNQPSWTADATFDPATGRLTGTPKNEDVGYYANVEITVTDSGGLSATLPFNIYVEDVNDAPVIASVPRDKVRLGTDYEFVPSAVDIDDYWQMPTGWEELTYSIQNKPDWATFDEVTGTLSGTPTDSAMIDDGGHVGLWKDVKITVYDDGDKEPGQPRLSDSLTFDILVILPNEPPVIEPQPFTVDEGSPAGTELEPGPVEATDEDGPDDLTYTITGGTGEGLFDIDPVTGQITVAGGAYPEDHDTTDDYTLIVNVNDGIADAAATMTINVIPVRPIVDLDDDDDGGDGPGGKPGRDGYDFDATFREGDDPVKLADADAIIENPDGTHIDSLTVTITNLKDGDVLAVDTTGTNITASYDGANGTLTLTGRDTDDNYTNVLQKITFENTSENPNQAERVIDFVAVDAEGDSSDTATCWVKVIAVNDPPVNHVPGLQSTSIDTPLNFSEARDNRIFVSDIDAFHYDENDNRVDDDVQVTLSVDQGTLSLPGGERTDDGTGEITLTGTIPDINAQLRGLTYTPLPGWTGEAELKIVTNDLGHTGEGGPLTDTDTVRIIVGIPHPHVPEPPPGPEPEGPLEPILRPDMGDRGYWGLGFPYERGEVQPTGLYLIPSASKSLDHPCGDDELYRCCTLEESLRLGCRFAPALDPESRLCNITWQWLEEEFGWDAPLLGEEQDLYSSVPEKHFLREANDEGLNGIAGDMGYAFFGGTEDAPYAQILSDEANFVQGSDGEFNAAPGELKYSFFGGRENLDVPATWGSDAWPMLGNVVPCEEDGYADIPESGDWTPAPETDNYGTLGNESTPPVIREENLSGNLESRAPEPEISNYRAANWEKVSDEKDALLKNDHLAQFEQVAPAKELSPNTEKQASQPGGNSVDNHEGLTNLILSLRKASK
ncbi:putative Ig domain-containing protein [Desulfonema magnum]|uniref:Cadherin domain-containing protein, DUF4347 n=1 Tax=Desulfonema magnum TaxID=45655 RepID=A0A975GU04_9BACT|nr:putative Ig domain-containing protein [Desulfonema magnum]QTA93644.1 Cadherin domain-containing protein, DUF4347 [Desulfonema magnum]